MAMAAHLLNKSILFFFFFTLVFPTLILRVSGDGHIGKCRSYCGNITVDYPFAVEAGCGHPGYRELLFCVNDVLMFHISSGSYRVLQIDYAFHSLILDDPRLSTCNSIVRGGKGNGFVVEPWRAPYLSPAGDNAFMLIGCSPQSPLFQGFPGKHLPCRNVSGMGCEEYYDCPAWETSKVLRGTSPPQCCTVSFEAIRAINLTKLQCEGYSSAYNLAPLRVSGASGWSYGIRVMYSVPGGDAFCRACESTGGVCGYHANSLAELCICGGRNSTSNCDSVSSAAGPVLSLINAVSDWGPYQYHSLFPSVACKSGLPTIHGEAGVYIGKRGGKKWGMSGIEGTGDLFCRKCPNPAYLCLPSCAYHEPCKSRSPIINRKGVLLKENERCVMDG